MRRFPLGNQGGVSRRLKFLPKEYRSSRKSVTTDGRKEGVVEGRREIPREPDCSQPVLARKRVAVSC
jgi:hypothetical protein